MRALKSCLVNSLRQGDNAYVHCVSGISGAPVAAAVLSSLLMGISLEEAKAIINQTRNVQFDGMQAGRRSMEGPWVEDLLREGVTMAEVPTGFSCRVSHPQDVVVHATTSISGGTKPICHWKKGAAGKRDFRADTIAVESIEEAANQLSGRFCSNCEPLRKASLRVLVSQL